MLIAAKGESSLLGGSLTPQGGGKETKLNVKLLGSLGGLRENKALKAIGVRAAAVNLPAGHPALRGAQHPLRCCPSAVPAWTPKSHHPCSSYAAETS